MEMTKEQLVRSEASEFLSDQGGSFTYLGHQQFIDQLRIELLNYYQTEYKMIYLDQVNIEVKKSWELHKKRNEEVDYDTDITYQKILFFIDQEISELPSIVHKTFKDNQSRKKVFISYSHFDKVWLDKLKRHFKPFESNIEFWEDSKIQAGQNWKEEISNAINSAKVGILLISADFFNSDFITRNELPPLLDLAEKDGATILSVILKPCLFEEYPSISQFQAMNSPKRTMLEMDEASQETIWVELVRQVKKIIDEK